MISVVVAVVLAACIGWICLALGLPALVGVVAALLVLLSGIDTGGAGFRPRGGV